MPVVAGEGLVGRVVATTSTRATVVLLRDPTSGVGVRAERSGVTGIAEGLTAHRDLQMTFVDSNADLKTGDLVVTSGLQNGRFPAGIPVGQIVSATREPSSLSLEVRIKPSVDFDRIEFVKVLRYQGAAK
jgi:rod shape-determining protein MreC